MLVRGRTRHVEFGSRLEGRLCGGADVVVDCSDTFATRYVVNEACCILGTPLVEAGLLGFDGLTMTIKPGSSACYRCAFPTEPAEAPSCAEAGVLGPVAGIVGSIQALEAIKLILDLGDPLVGRLLAYDSLEQSFRAFKVRRDPECPACGEYAAPIVIAEYDEHCLPHAVLADGTTTH